MSVGHLEIETEESLIVITRNSKKKVISWLRSGPAIVEGYSSLGRKSGNSIPVWSYTLCFVFKTSYLLGAVIGQVSFLSSNSWSDQVHVVLLLFVGVLYLFLPSAFIVNTSLSTFGFFFKSVTSKVYLCA